MFDNKTIVGIGCSHTYGTYLTDDDPITCHQRSWIKKLEQKTNAVNSINLSLGGGSNRRSWRVCMDYVLEDIQRAKQSVIFIGITDPSRIELASNKDIKFNHDPFCNENYEINRIGHWQSDMYCNYPTEYTNFIKFYYGVFSVTEYDYKMTNYMFLNLHSFLSSYNIEHYFPVMLSDANYYKKYLKTVPYVQFNIDSAVLDAVEFLKRNKFAVGRNIDPTINCNHFDHDANEFLADCIIKKIQSNEV